MLKLLLPFALLGTACTSPYDSAENDGDDDTTHAPAAVPQDAYLVHSSIGITLEQLLPASGYQVTQTLRDFSTEPGSTLLDLADDAGVPAVGTLRSVLPDILEDKLIGYLDAEIAKAQLGGVPVTTVAGSIVGFAEQALTHLEIDSTLRLDGTPSHEINSLSLQVAGEPWTLSLDALPEAVTTAALSSSTQGTMIRLGDHCFGLAIGSYAWAAIDQAIAANYGGTLRELLGAAVNCPLVAQHVANKCVLGQCIGHANEMTEICERGLDEVVDQARAQVESFNLDALHFASGTATMSGLRSDGAADTLANGTWAAEINLGQGLRPATGTFEAHALAN